MIRKIVLAVSCLFAMSLFGSAFAVVVSTLYQAEVPVASHAPADWQKALAPALQQVLIKVTGNANVGQIGLVRNALAKAEGYVQSYNYASADNGRMMTVQVRFSPKAVNDLLQQAAQSLLSKDRPLTIVWLAVQNTGGAQPVALNDKNPVAVALQRDAGKLALPLLWPAMDLRDLSAITTNQIWSLDQAAAQAASQRYQADAVLLGKIAPMGKNNWQGQWLLLNGGANQSWQTQGNNPSMVATNTLSQLSRRVMAASASGTSNTLANIAGNKIAAVSPGGAASIPSSGVPIDVTLKVSGIHGLDDYSALVDYLRSLAAVSKLSVLQTQGDQLFIRIKVAGAKEMLIKELAEGSQLQPMPDSSGQYVFQQAPMEPPTLLYRWLGNKPSNRPATAPRRSASIAPRPSYPPVIHQYVVAENQRPVADEPGLVESYPMDDADNQYASHNNQVPIEVTP
jgi:hypothetical protein